MANVSDFCEIELYPEKRLFINHQSDTTIASEIRRGINLRKKKPLPSRRKENFPVRADLKSPSVRKRTTCNGLSMSCPGCCHWTIPCGYNYIKPRVTRKTRLKCMKEKACPLRTAELALPTKRHCLDTWRYRSNLLPDFMVERLRQHVMDLHPVVQIPEAIDYFRRRKTKSCKRPTEDTIKKLLKEMKMPLCRLNTNTLCLIFAQKIIQKLSKPLRISLNDDFEKIARVIVGDIVQITKGKKYMTAECLEKYRSIHSDVINKITIWIVGILEEQAYKQLEENLREFEEEAGPVLDFIDDLLDNVLNICLPIPTKVSTEKESVTTKSSDSSSSAHSVEELADTEYFTNLINNLISEFDEQFKTEDDENYISEKDDLEMDVHLILEDLLKAFISSDNISLAEAEESLEEIEETDVEYFKNEIYNIINTIGKESTDKFNENDDTLITLLDSNVQNDIDDQLKQTLSVGEMIEDTEERGKKVIFSVLDLVTNSDDPRQSDTQDHTKPNILFAEPNEHLLSDADESWPSDKFSPATLRPSASVTKSISSLGQLAETDEKNMSLSLIDSGTDEKEDENHDLTTKESNATIATKEVQVNTYVKNTSLKEIESQTDPIKSPVKGNLNVSGTTMNSFSSKPVVKKKDDKNALKTKKEGSRNKGTVTDSSENINKRNTERKVSQAAPSKVTKKYAQGKPRERDTSLTSKDSTATKEVQVNTYVVNKIPKDNERKRDPIKSPKKGSQVDRSNVGGTAKVVQPTSFSPKPAVKKTNKNMLKKKNEGSGKEETIISDYIDNTNKVNAKWRVSQAAAPSWVTQRYAHGEAQKRITLRPGQATMRRNDIQKWCANLDTGYKNLDIWKDWLQSTCEEITELWRKNGGCTCSTNKKYMHLLRKLKNSVDKDATYWSKMNKATHERFQRLQKCHRNYKMALSNHSACCFCKMNIGKPS